MIMTTTNSDSYGKTQLNTSSFVKPSWHDDRAQGSKIDQEDIISNNETNKVPPSKFPLFLYDMLEETAKIGPIHVVSWTSDGKGFKIHDYGVFTSFVLKKYFPHQSKMKSFQRQLYFYSFARIPFGVSKGAYTHPLLVRGKRHLCQKMQRRKQFRSKKPSKPKTKILKGKDAPKDTHDQLDQSSKDNSLHAPREMLISSCALPPRSSLPKLGSNAMAVASPTTVGAIAIELMKDIMTPNCISQGGTPFLFSDEALVDDIIHVFGGGAN